MRKNRKSIYFRSHADTVFSDISMLHIAISLEKLNDAVLIDKMGTASAKIQVLTSRIVPKLPKLSPFEPDKQSRGAAMKVLKSALDQEVVVVGAMNKSRVVVLHSHGGIFFPRSSSWSHSFTHKGQQRPPPERRRILRNISETTKRRASCDRGHDV